MPPRPEWFVLYGAVAVLYLFVAWREWLALKSESARTPVWHGPVLALAIGLHGVLLVHGVYVEGQLRFGFAHALSATLWITAIIVWIETFFSPSRGLFLLVLPLAAITTLLPVAYPGAILGQATEAPMFRVHLLLAILAYSLLTIAAMQALVIATMDRRLHGETAGASGGRPRALPGPPAAALPNAAAPVFAYTSLTLATSILSAATLSFLGLGVQPPMSEWGDMAAHGRLYMMVAPHLVVIPSLTIALVVLCLNLVGDGVRDALDPRLRN